MSGAHRPAVAVAQVGRLPAPKAAPAVRHVTRSVLRAIGIGTGGPPARSGSLVAKAYQAPSSPRITEGSAKVSATSRLTGFTYTGTAAASAPDDAPSGPTRAA